MDIILNSLLNWRVPLESMWVLCFGCRLLESSLVYHLTFGFFALTLRIERMKRRRPADQAMHTNTYRAAENTSANVTQMSCVTFADVAQLLEKILFFS